MSFIFFKPFRPKSAAELVKSTRDALAALDDKTVADVRLLDKALEEVDKNLLAMKHMILGDGEAEPSPDLVVQLVAEVCKDDFLEILIHKLPNLGWEARKDTVQVWCILLRQKGGLAVHCLENHPELLDFLISCYQNKDTALNCGVMLRECSRFASLAAYMLESASFELFFKLVELPNFDIASDAFTTFKELLTRHGSVVNNYLNSHYDQFFELYERLLSSSNYVTKRQSLKLLGDFLLDRSNTQVMLRYISDKRNLLIVMTLLKDPSKSIQSSAFHIFKVFVANPKKPAPIVHVLAKNRDRLLRFLDKFHLDKGTYILTNLCCCSTIRACGRVHVHLQRTSSLRKKRSCWSRRSRRWPHADGVFICAPHPH
ncbi:calcium-binding protein 39 isoform X2 [Selaginella moellendorffii]|uniref:calcium-binding protein 39 isoform X2 n=1 Tax=Selaginella moellendorffii TaxID=88036 RepID=UPI000D1CC7D3|nr:calcium-binding protein 39 isoform X2 [Selaginella moellendorffii]|eukprot:XP_024538775.1 calcium-binding protein 39 isoform X2 [Selaginella moellendorffii]